MIGVGGNPYLIGSYDSKTMVFTPDDPKWQSVDPGNYYAVNPHMFDDKGPGRSTRRLLHAWVTTGRSPTKTVPYWEGAHSIPRVITIDDGRLIQQPIPELQSLRGEKRSLSALAVGSDSQKLLEGIEGDALEIIATFKPGDAKRFGLKVRTSADGKTNLPVWFDVQKREFGVADTRSPSHLKPGEPVRMQIFVDRSIIEVYLNGNPITKVAFIAPSATGVAVFAEGGSCTLETIDAWKMKSMWESGGKRK